MELLKLKKLSKYYYQKGIVASGISNINLEFKQGEFVVITGESGSGKSTLLNVISGLDSYEEGEMYINGEETSHYREVDFHFYRKKYVSNIFQTFNLVNSYTVYQNIELVLLLNGYKKKEIKDKVLNLIDEVNLTKYKNTKVSKLSGGQKQRVAIARALAKDTPIIVCDEPTGNLDSKSAKEVLKLLKRLSEDKLVIMVTHNFDDVSEYATRVITMHDGKVLSDKEVTDVGNVKYEIDARERKIKPISMLRLGIRNTFNVIPKFLLILAVFLFVSLSLISEYLTMKVNQDEFSEQGTNYFFQDISQERIIINKKDKSPITDEEYNNISKLDNVNYIVKNDIILDTYVWANGVDKDPISISGKLKRLENYEYDKVDIGKMPESDNEVIAYSNKNDYYLGEKNANDIIGKYFNIEGNSNLKIKLVGIKYLDEIKLSFDNTLYLSDNMINKYMYSINSGYSITSIMFNGSYITYSVMPSNKVPKGNVIIPSEITATCKNYSCKGYDLKVIIKNIYYEDTLNLKVSNYYTDKTIKNLTGYSYDMYNGNIFVNDSDYNSLFNKDNYQSSVFAKDKENIDELEKELQNLGYNTLQIRKTLHNDMEEFVRVFMIIKMITTIGLVITLFFISYFVIKLILKSRNTYYTTLRILGATSNYLKKMLDIELILNASIAYIIMIVFILLVKYNIINNKDLLELVNYSKVSDYIILYFILILISYIISSRYSRKVFSKSVMNTYNEEV